jgi:hypothetical protein
MALSNHDQVRIREYLLGKLGEDEQEKIEERLMLEDDLFQELEIIKGELIEEYRDGELTSNERKSFENGFLSSPDGRQRYAFAVAVGCVVHHSQPQPVSWWERISPFFRMPQWATAAMALVVVVVIVSILWVQSRQQPKFVAVNLTNSAVTRGARDTQHVRIVLPPDASELRISLALPQPVTPGARYRVELDNRRERTSLQPAGQDANSVSVVIPAKQVPAGFYALVVYEIQANGTEQQIPGNYFFITQ